MLHRPNQPYIVYEPNESASEKVPLQSGLFQHPRESARRFTFSKSAPFPWSVVIPTSRREKGFEGMLYGCAIAESMSLTRDGIHPRLGLKLYGREFEYRFVPGLGVPSHVTHSLVVTVQSVLRSRSSDEDFIKNLHFRMGWYRRSYPVRYSCALFDAIRRQFSNRSMASRSLTIEFGDNPLVRSMVLSLMHQGNDNDAIRWIRKSTGLTHSDERVSHAAILTAFAAQIAQMIPNQELHPSEVLETLIDSTEEEHLLHLLALAREGLRNRWSVKRMSEAFGGVSGVPNDARVIAVLGIYAWLRHVRRFRNCVVRCVLLGGQSTATATISGILSGISLGIRGMPTDWIRKLAWFPYSKDWRQAFIERVRDWPHGMEDIQKALPAPGLFPGQLLRNCNFGLFRAVHRGLRLPYQLSSFAFEPKKRRITKPRD